MPKAKLTIALEARVAELEAANAALEARLALARTSYRALRDSVRQVEHAAQEAHVVTPVVTRYHDALGREWIKTRTGSRAVSRLAEACDA